MLSVGWLLSVAAFSVSMSGTPGPNNVMLTASGALYGYRRTLPHIAGILLGCFVLFSAVALGLGAVFERFPLVQQILRIAGSAYLLYLAARIATAPPPQFAAGGNTRPFTLWQGALFQFVNPKAWVMGLALTSGFMPADGPLWLNAFGLAALVEAVAFPCVSFWAGFGIAIAQRLNTATAWRCFNAVMGAVTAACVGFIVV